MSHFTAILTRTFASRAVFVLVAVGGLSSCAGSVLSPDGGAGDLARGGDLALGDAAGDAAQGCAGYLDLVADNGAPQHYPSICPGSWGKAQSSTAVGYRFAGGPFPGVHGIDANGCLGNGKTEGVYLSARESMGPGTYLASTVTYTDSFGDVWTNNGYPASIVITRFDSVGGVIEGSFTATVTVGSDSRRELKGTFHVCRVPDELLP